MPDGKSFAIHLWDIPGSERYFILNKAQIQGADALIFVYS